MSETRLLKFEADWCGPCQQQTAILEDFDLVPVEECDIEETQDMASEYGVMSIPTLILLQDGEEVHRWTGVTEAAVLEEDIDYYL